MVGQFATAKENENDPTVLTAQTCFNRAMGQPEQTSLDPPLLAGTAGGGRSSVSWSHRPIGGWD